MLWDDFYNVILSNYYTGQVLAAAVAAVTVGTYEIAKRMICKETLR